MLPSLGYLQQFKWPLVIIIARPERSKFDSHEGENIKLSLVIAGSPLNFNEGC